MKVFKETKIEMLSEEERFIRDVFGAEKITEEEDEAMGCEEGIIVDKKFIEDFYKNNSKK